MEKINYRRVILLVVIIITIIIGLKYFKQNKKVEYRGEEQFYYKDRVYTELTKEDFEYLTNNKQVSRLDLGKELFKLEYNELEVKNNTTYCEEIGECEVYEYNRIDSEALLVVKGKEGYKLFAFSNFINETQEELFDATKTIELYNMKAENISSIEILEEKSNDIKLMKTVTDENLIKKFYEKYKELKDVGNVVYNDDLNEDIVDFSDIENVYSERLKNAKIIKINMRNKLYVELNYYPEISYMIDNNSYYKIDKELLQIIQEIISE